MISNWELSKKIAENISSELNFDSDKEEVIAYGIFGLLQIIFSIGMIAIFGFIFGVMEEAIIISVVMAIVRKSSGGVHATSPLRCMIIGTAICIGMSKLILMSNPSLNTTIIINILIFIIAYYFIYKVSPVDTPNKPIKKAEKRIKLKRISLINITVFLGVIILFICLYKHYGYYKFIMYSNCVSLGVLLQTITLTKLGHRLFSNIDVILSKFIN